MAVLTADTLPEIERMLIEALREMPPCRKLELLGEMSRTVCELAVAGLRQRYPDDTPEQRKRRLADLLLGAEMAERVYGRLRESEC
jgi:hypothetical protein